MRLESSSLVVEHPSMMMDPTYISTGPSLPSASLQALPSSEFPSHGHEFGGTQVKSGLLPEDKMQLITEARESGTGSRRQVIMVRRPPPTHEISASLGDNVSAAVLHPFGRFNS